MMLDLTDEESAALLRELNNIIENDRYPLSPRIRTLREYAANYPAHRQRRRQRDRRALAGPGVKPCRCFGTSQ
jgi:hypothetical protein